MTAASDDRLAAWLGVLIFFLFSGIYFTIGSRLAHLPIYLTSNDIFFGADHLEAVKGWTAFDGRHYHDGAHPLTILLLVPVGTLLTALAGSPSTGILILNVIGGGLTVALGYACFYRLARRPYAVLAPALFFGFTMSQLIFGSLPDTYALAGATLALSYLLLIQGLQTGHVRLGAWQVAGFLTLAILITNFVQTAIAYSGFVITRCARGRVMWMLLSFAVPILAVTVLLSLLQRQLFPSSKLFFSPDTVTRQSDYMDLAMLRSQPFNIAREVLRNTSVINIVGIDPSTTTQGNNPDARFTFYQTPLHYSTAGVLALFLWGGLFLEGLYRNMVTRQTRTYAVILGLILLFNMGLYILYNVSELFLYSTHVTLLVLLLGFHSMSLATRPRLAAWWLAAGLVAANNLMVLERFLVLLRHM